MRERLKAAWAALRGVGGMELPNDGRSSVEGSLAGRIAGALSGFGVSTVFDPAMLACLKHLWVFNPNFSQYVGNVINLANTGHKVVINAASAQKAEAAATRLNEAAARLYELGAGVDGLVNDELAQIAWSGAVSSEDVVDLAARRVERVVLVPVEQIRFDYIEGRYVPFQQPGTLVGQTGSPLGLIRLNELTYHYYALQRVENSPYAKPPGTAAIGAITGPQKDMLDNLKYISQKFGLLGLLSVACTPPGKKNSETDEEWFARSQKYLAKVVKALEPSLKQGLLVHFNTQKVSSSPVAGDARGADAIFNLNEHQVFSGLNTFPAFHGRTDSTTETYAWVVYQFMTAQAGNVQRLVKRRREATYRLDLRLGGVEVDGVSFQFNRANALKPLEEAEADDQRFQTAKEKAECGMISPDEAAQECGYESAFDPDLMVANSELAGSLQRASRGAGRAQRAMPVTLRFDRGAHQYRFVPPRYELGDAAAETGQPANVLALKKKLA